MNATEVIRELAEHSLLSDREFDGVGFIDRLLLLASEFGQVRATLAAEGTLRFEASGHAPCDVPLERAKSKLRMLCARLAVLCKESGSEFILYGGEGLIREKALTAATASGSNGPPEAPTAARSTDHSWSVRLKNTTDAQEFTITAN